MLSWNYFPRLFWFLYPTFSNTPFYVWAHFTHFSGISIVSFEQVNAGWVYAGIWTAERSRSIETRMFCLCSRLKGISSFGFVVITTFVYERWSSNIEIENFRSLVLVIGSLSMIFFFIDFQTF